MASKKTAVIEWLFRRKYDPGTGTVSSPVVAFEEIDEGIRALGVDLSTANPANFWKDLVRHNTLSKNWPVFVFAAGYYGADAIGEGESASFKFVPIPADHDVDELKYDPDAVATHRVQSLTMPMAMKALARRGDENWLAQVASRLAVIETHFAVFSSRLVEEISFLQTNVKLAQGETDVAYALVDNEGLTWLVSVEAKGRGESLHGPQIARAAYNLQSRYGSKVGAAGTIPFGMKVVDDSLLHTLEFEPVIAASDRLVVASEGAIRLVPAVAGIR